MSIRVPILGVMTLVGLALAACGGASVTPTSAPTTTPTALPTASPKVAQLILRVTTEGGFIGPSASLNMVPSVSVYDDGRILTPGPVTELYPGPLVPPVSQRSVGAAGATMIVAAIRAAGLDKEATAGGVPGDTGVSVFNVTLDGRTVTTRYALGGGPGRPGGGGGGSDSPAIAAAIEFLTRLTDPAESWGQPASGEVPYEASGYRIFVAPGAPVADPSTTQVPVAWPLATTLAQFGSPAVPDRGIAGLRLGAAIGADAAALTATFATATVITPFTSGGQPYTLYVRPLLPDELAGAH